mmetsp:Transcript_7274/g.15943  ORF Transcript_7274/g.15943 Transcript_7274/m.15943 type:complete len:780 (-) Transcript_7274:437-2776(-)
MEQPRPERLREMKDWQGQCAAAWQYTLSMLHTLFVSVLSVRCSSADPRPTLSMFRLRSRELQAPVSHSAVERAPRRSQMPYSLSMLFELDAESEFVPSSEASLEGSSSIGLCWYGRGLHFTPAEAVAFSRALGDPSSPTASLESDLRAILPILTGAIRSAWGDEELEPGSGHHPFRPGVLVRRSDGVLVPETVVAHPLDTPTYVNHATATTYAEWAGYSYPTTGETRVPFERSVADNEARMRPPLDEAGLPFLEPLGKPQIKVQPAGLSYDVDGYGVTYKAGFTWTFNLGFDLDNGISAYNVRLRLPPSAAHPDGEEVALFNRLAISTYGSDYSTTSAGALYGAFFEENNFAYVFPLSACAGTTLPLFYSREGPHKEGADVVIEPSTLLPPALSESQPVDPFGFGWPMQAFPIDKGHTGKGILASAVCLEEGFSQHEALWHMYSAQHLRSLTVKVGAISEAYNMVNYFTFRSDAKLKVGQAAQGKPGVVTTGIPGRTGAYASGGKGGFASNHIHWAMVNLEPSVREAPVQALLASDLAPPAETQTDWFGDAFLFKATDVSRGEQSAELSYDYDKQRKWLLAARDEAGSDLGALRLSSHAWGTHIKPGTKTAAIIEAGVSPSSTFYGSHWFLRDQDLFVVNATGKRTSTVLGVRQPLLTAEEAATASWGAPPPNTKGLLSKTPSIFAVLKLVHNVNPDELPVQNGFTDISVDIMPEGLFGFNPNILTRYDPYYASAVVSNKHWDLSGGNSKAIELPYTSETNITGLTTTNPYCAYVSAES